jgi:alpha-galactosidase
LTNKEVISVNQDSLGVQGLKWAVKDSVETWLKPLSNGDWALTFLNRSQRPENINFNFQNTVINDTVSKRTFDAKAATYNIKNLWTKKELGSTKKPLKTVVPRTIYCW